MFSEAHILARLSRMNELLEQSQKVARIGSWEWIAGEEKVLWTNEMFALLELNPPTDNCILLEAAYGFIHSNDADRVRKIHSEQDTATHREFDYTWVTSSGTHIRVHCWFERFFDEQGNLLKVRGTCQDITPFRKIEEEYDRQHEMLHRAEETAKMGSWKYNFASQQVYFSDNLYELFGIEKKENETDIARMFEPIMEEDAQQIMSVYQQTIADGNERSINFRLMRDGQIRYFNSNGKIAFNKLGEKIIVGNVQDITEQHLLQKKLEAQNDFIQKLIDSSVNAVSVLDRQKKYVLWNKCCEEMHGLKMEEVIDKTSKQIFNDPELDWLEAATEKAFQGETIRKHSFRYVNGKYYEAHLIPLKSQTEEIENVLILMHETTELIELNEKLRHQMEFAEALVDHSEACIFVFDRDFHLITWNKKCTESYKLSKDEVIGKTVEEIFPNADLSEVTRRLETALQGETIHYPEISSHIVDKYFDSYVIPIKDKNGSVASVLVVLNDITDIINISKRAKEANRLLEQKKSELAERTYFLETVLDASGDYIGAYDKDLKLIEINKASLRRYQYKKEDAIGKSVYELFPGIEGTLQLDNIKQALTGVPIRDYEFQSLKGEKFFVASAIPLKDKNGEVFAALAIGHEITEMKKAALEMEQLNNLLGTKNHELNRINSELASFSYVASHDLQEPLRKIQAFISLILAKDFSNLSVNAQDYFKRIQASANRMQQMIDGLLSFSRTNSAAKNFEEKKLNLIFTKLLRELQDEILQKQAIIQVDTEQQLQVIPHQFEQMLQHILSNALKFQKEGNQPEIHIRSSIVAGKEIEGEVAQRDSDYCKISISDNGVGFDMENVEKIFQMFQRLHGKSEFSGTGIGLSICRRIAQNHNGFITAESEPDKGSTFHVFIPLVQPATQSFPQQY